MEIDYLIRTIAVMALVTYAVRMLPLLLIKKKIENKFISSFLFYIPYAVLAAMVIPDIFYSTQSVISAAAGLVTAVVLSLANRKLITVAMLSCVAVYITEFVIRYVQTGLMSF